MKNVLIISSSPRRHGNSDLLCDMFAKGAEESGNNVEKIFLKDKEINYCTGCGVCNTTHRCIIKDDMAEILDEMVNADVIVLATPVYFYSMAAQDCLDGAREAGIIYGTGAWQIGEIKNTDAYEQAYQMGKGV